MIPEGRLQPVAPHALHTHTHTHIHTSSVLEVLAHTTAHPGMHDTQSMLLIEKRSML
jgi:hypothetical protein